VRQTSRNLHPVDCWQNFGSCASEPSIEPRRAGPSPWKSVWISPGPWSNGNDFRRKPASIKMHEITQDLRTGFVDFTKSLFDSVSREGLWKIMVKLGCLKIFISVVRQFHDGMMANVLDDGSGSEAFPVTNGAKQGCVLAPTLFSMMFSAMLTYASGQGCGVRGKMSDSDLFRHKSGGQATFVSDKPLFVNLYSGVRLNLKISLRWLLWLVKARNLLSMQQPSTVHLY